MPKLDSTGPDGKGSNSGRKLGNCKSTLTDDQKIKILGTGLGMRRKNGGGIGLKKRLQSGKQ